MNRQDLILLSVVYALVIAASHSGPLLDRLKKLPWDRPVSLDPQNDPVEAGINRFWAAQGRHFLKFVRMVDRPAPPIVLKKKNGPGPPMDQARRPVPVMIGARPAFHRVRPLVHVQRTPSPGPEERDPFDRERGPQG